MADEDTPFGPPSDAAPTASELTEGSYANAAPTSAELAALPEGPPSWAAPTADELAANGGTSINAEDIASVLRTGIEGATKLGSAAIDANKAKQPTSGATSTNSGIVPPSGPTGTGQGKSVAVAQPSAAGMSPTSKVVIASAAGLGFVGLLGTVLVVGSRRRGGR